MDKFFKSFEIKDYKATETPFGGFEAVFNEMFYVDDGGDITIGVSDLEKFVKNGFAPDTHGMSNGYGGNYTYKDTLGYPTHAEVRGYSIFGGFAFHSDASSQSVRVKMQERMNAGKTVSMSIGYYLTEPPIYVEAKDYETKLAEFIPEERLNSCVERAKLFPAVRLIKVGLFEVSPVPIPMNTQSLVTSIKTDEEHTTRRQLSADGEAALEQLTKATETLNSFSARTESIAAKRIAEGVKAGRMFSRTNEGLIRDCCDMIPEKCNELMAIHEKLSGMLDQLYAKPEEEKTAETTETTEVIITEEPPKQEDHTDNDLLDEAESILLLTEQI